MITDFGIWNKGRTWKDIMHRLESLKASEIVVEDANTDKKVSLFSQKQRMFLCVREEIIL